MQRVVTRRFVNNPVAVLKLLAQWSDLMAAKTNHRNISPPPLISMLQEVMSRQYSLRDDDNLDDVLLTIVEIQINHT